MKNKGKKAERPFGSSLVPSTSPALVIGPPAAVVVVVGGAVVVVVSGGRVVVVVGGGAVVVVVVVGGCVVALGSVPSAGAGKAAQGMQGLIFSKKSFFFTSSPTVV